jgi:hypothetical protein
MSPNTCQISLRPKQERVGEGDREAVEGASAADSAALINEFEHRIERVVHLVIGYADDLPGSRTQECFATGIVPALLVAAMRRALNFDDQARANAGEVGNERPNGMLSAELHSTDAAPQA